MIPTPFRGYHPENADRVALIAVEPSADRQLYLLRVSRGPTRAKLRLAATLGPYAEEDLAVRFQTAVQELRAEGYWPGGVLALLDGLHHPDSAVRARAALRLGWRRCADVVDNLIQLLPDAVDESCSFLDALGMIGDRRAIPILRDYSERKLLSRRRSAAEALRRIGDVEGVEHIRQRALARLPEDVRTAFDSAEGNQAKTAAQLIDVFSSLEPQQQALCLDTLYELATPATLSTVRTIIRQITFARPFLWRGVKSVFKRSQLRHDYVTFGQLSHAIEMQGRTSGGVFAQVKSGYDGAVRQSSIFAKKTQDFLRRMSWRFLTDLARYQPESYAPAAAEALIPYGPEDVAQHGTRRCYLLHQILLGRSRRFVFNGRRMSFHLRSRKMATAPAGVREESHPELWDARPEAYVRVLAAARLEMAHVFAVDAVRNRHPNVMRTAAHQDILAMLGAPYEATVELALAELDRRFDPDAPDWALLRQMLDDERAMARTVGQRWLRLTAHLWLKDADRIIDFLAIRPPNLRALIVEMVAGALLANSLLRQELAQRLVTILRSPEEPEGAFAGYAAVVQEALAEEFAQLVSVMELAGWIAKGSPAVKTMAGGLLTKRADAIAELGLERLTALAEHELVAVRTAAHSLLVAALPQLRGDPSVLFVLVESDWDDTRTVAFDLLRNNIDIAALGLDGVMGLLDSNRTDVQDLGKELAERHIAALPGDELVLRLVQHPHANMRQFAIDLAVQYLPESGESLAQLKGFCRAALLDPWPNRSLKRSVIEFLAARGMEDVEQAEQAAAVLGDMVRLHGKTDADNALEALVRIKLAHPEAPSTVELVSGGEA